MKEQKFYLDKINNFLNNLKGSVIVGIKFDIDNNPTFDKSEISFKFEYCNSILLKVDDLVFKMSTAMTTLGFETLLIEKLNYFNAFEFDYIIESQVISAGAKFDNSQFAYRIDIKCKSSELTFMASEIYDAENGGWYGKTPDEMIFVFYSFAEADKYLNLTKCA